MKRTFHKAIAALSAIFVLAVAIMVPAHHADAAINSATGSNLGNLFVLGSLFGNNDSTGILSNNNGSVDLGNMIVLDQLFGGNTFGSTARSGGLFSNSSNSRGSLGELIILNQLFNNNNTLGLGGGGNNNLGRLFVLDRLFADP